MTQIKQIFADKNNLGNSENPNEIVVQDKKITVQTKNQ